VPAEANLELALSGDGAEETRSKSRRLRVPRRVALGAGKGLAIRSVHREPGGEHDRVVVEVAAPEGCAGRSLRRRPDARLVAAAARAEREQRRHVRRFTFDLDGLPPGAQAEGVTLTFTAVSGDDAIEVPVHLD
jgi:hypothetical protein